VGRTRRLALKGPDLKIAGILATIMLPYLIWVNARMLWKGEIFLTDDSGNVTSHHKRADDPAKYWLLAAFNLALLSGCTAFVVWTFGGFGNSN
jgi:hypothetical protein